MRYKAKVLKRFPTAEAVVRDTWPDGSPRRVVIRADGKTLDIGGVHDQLHGAAWRSAYYWTVRTNSPAP